MGKTAAVILNDHQKNQLWEAKEAEMKKKYKAQIANFCHFHNVGLSVGWDMLFFNARCFAQGVKGEVIQGGGEINVPELVKDYKEIMQYVTKL
jgi:hypothetical protein